MKNYVRLARFTLEKEVIAQFSNSFGLTIPANLLFYYKKSLAEFISRTAQSFFIDPMTYIFTYPENMLKTEDFELKVDSSGNYKLKKSFEKLICAYDEGLLELFRSRGRLPPSYFENSATAEGFVKNNISYQKNLLRESLDRISMYEAMLGLDDSENPNLQPEFITAPYFYFRDTSDPWYDVTVRLSQLTKQFSPDDEVYAVVCVDKQSLNNTLVDRIVSDFGELDGFLLFVSDFNESTESVQLLGQLRSFVNRLHEEASKPVVNLYGGFFSILLNYNGLDGVSSGLCILDHRDATAEYTGARAPIRFYVPSLRDKLSEQDFKTFLQSFNPTDECDCSFCQLWAKTRNTLSSREFGIRIARLFMNDRGQIMTESMGHFMYNRLRESEMVRNSSLPEIRAIIEANRASSEKYRVLINTGNFTDRVLHVFQP
jgi:hypothetical protein